MNLCPVCGDQVRVIANPKVNVTVRFIIFCGCSSSSGADYTQVIVKWASQLVKRVQDRVEELTAEQELDK
jgi:hypothetical protein